MEQKKKFWLIIISIKVVILVLFILFLVRFAKLR